LEIKTLNERILMTLTILLQHPICAPTKQAGQGDIDVTRRPVISIVDDDPLVRDGIGDLVTSLGYRSLTFESPEEFLESGQVSNTICLITDLHMPGLNGLDLQQRLLDKGYCTPVIFVTAFPDGKARERALKAGAVAFLSKPFEESSLISAVGSALSA
jgi:FixJ family two-component response regulator